MVWFWAAGPKTQLGDRGVGAIRRCLGRAATGQSRLVANSHGSRGGNRLVLSGAGWCGVLHPMVRIRWCVQKTSQCRSGIAGSGTA